MIGSSEVIVILIIALLLFGPKKLPELTKSLGRAVAEYHKAVRDFEREVEKAKDKAVKETRLEGIEKRYEKVKDIPSLTKEKKKPKPKD